MNKISYRHLKVDQFVHPKEFEEKMQTFERRILKHAVRRGLISEWRQAVLKFGPDWNAVAAAVPALSIKQCKYNGETYLRKLTENNTDPQLLEALSHSLGSIESESAGKLSEFRTITILNKADWFAMSK